MKKLRWQIIVVVLALAAIAILLLSRQATPLLPTQGEDQPVAGGVYTEALIGSIGRLNPLLDYYNPADYDVDRLVFSRLIEFDSRGLPYGDLADTWGISKDGKSYSFSIRPDAYWHDGQPVTAGDVVFTVEKMRDDRMPMPADVHAFWQQVDVQAVDEKTVKFVLPEPFSPFLDYLSFGVVPQHLLDGLSGSTLVDAPYNLAPVGSGPYRIESVDAEGDQITGLTLRAFPEYYAGPLFLEKIIFRYYTDETSAMAAYEAGEVMGISRLSGSNLKRALRMPNLNVYTGRLPRLSLIYLNMDDPSLPFFQDANVRRALLMGINRRYIIDNMLDGQAIQAHGPIFPDSWAYYDGIEQIEFDPEAAINLLKAAGYSIPGEGGNVRQKDGVPLAFELIYPDGELYGRMAEQIRKDWARIGVQADLRAVSYDTLIAEYLEPRTYQAALVDINFSRSPDPDPYPFWHQAQIVRGQNYAQWDDRQVSEYLEQARVIDDFEQRARRYRNFQVRFAQELPALPLFYPVYSYGVDAQVRGVSIGPLYDPSDRFTPVANWHMRTGGLAQAPATATAGP